MATKRRRTGAAAGKMTDQHVLEDGVFRLENWLPYEFSFVANRVSSMLARMYRQRFKLSVVGWRVLAILNNESPLSAKQVTERTAMSAVNVSRAVAHLAKLGMVKRSSNQEDYRQVMLSPSKKGQDAYRQVLPLATAIEQELLQAMSADDRELLRRFMSMLSRSAADRLPETRDWRGLLHQGDAPP
jgi:DNA-binding MarR family transcriptional regulator